MAVRLTEEERGYVAQGAAADAGFLPALLPCLPYLAPVALFGAYGAAIGDVTAIALALACLIALNLWWIHGQGRSARIFKAVCRKIVADTVEADRADMA